MGFLMIYSRLNIIILLLFMLISACGTLRIRDFPEQLSSDEDPLITSKNSFTRNTIGREELSPPLSEVWTEDYTSLPNNGFTAVDNWLLFGTYNGYLAVADIDDGDLKGKRNLGDACATPPTIHDKVLYQSFETGSYGLIAYNISGGYILWRLDDHFSRSSPIIVNNNVLFQTVNGEVLCLDIEEGEEVWRISLQTSLRNSAAYHDGKLIIATLEGKILALDHNSGDVIWEVDIRSPIMADPVIEGDAVYILSHKGSLFVYDLSSGAERHKQNFGIHAYHGPTIDSEKLYLPLGDGSLLSLSKTDFKQNWIFEGDGPAAGSALITDSYAYLTTLAGILYILDKNNGALLQTIELSGRARSTPIIKKGKLIISVENKQVNAYAKE
jgi:outer membrane protein assembly factor BamB